MRLACCCFHYHLSVWKQGKAAVWKHTGTDLVSDMLTPKSECASSSLHVRTSHCRLRTTLDTQSHLISLARSICASTRPHTQRLNQQQHISFSKLDGSNQRSRIPTSPKICEHLIDYFHIRLKAINCLLLPALPSLSLSALVKMPAVLNCSG